MFISVKDRNLFHLVNTIGNIFTRGFTTRENITYGVHSMKLISFTKKKTNILYVFSVAVRKKYLTRLGELVIFELLRENYHFSKPS